MTCLNLSGFKYNPDGLSYLSPKKKKTLFFSVLAAHFLLIICPLIFALFSDFVNPPIKGIAVTLVEIPYVIEGAPSKNPSKDNPNPSDDLPAPPDKLSDIPDVEPLPEPLPEPEPVKPKEKVEKKPVEKIPVKEDSKPAPKEKKKSSLLKPEDIKKSTTIVKGSKGKTKGKASEISKFLKDFGTSTKAGGGAGPKGDPNADDSYYRVIGSFLKSRWSKPSQNTLGGKLPEVLIELSIDASGRLLNARIVQASGVNAMDLSVKALLNNLKDLPKPPRQMTFQVLMRIED